MVNDFPEQQAEQNNQGEIDHTAYAFLAAKNGDHDFLEVLLGPSIPAEKRQLEQLLADRQAQFDKSNLWEFRHRLATEKLAVLSRHKGGADVIRSVNEELRLCTASVIELCADAWLDRCGVHSMVYYNAAQPQFPILDHYDRKHGYSADKMGDFFVNLGINKPEGQAYYALALNQEIKTALKALQVARYERQAECVEFEIREISDIADCVDDLKGSIDVAEMQSDKLSEQVSPLNNQIGELNDIRYNERKQRFNALVEKFVANPSSLPSVYRLPAPALAQCLKSAKVPVESRDAAGNTLLHAAAEVKKYNVVRLLLERGANLSARNNINATPSEVAGLTSEAELKGLARVYQKRYESKFLADVNKDFQAYKNAHEEVLSSYKRYLHTQKRLAERTKQLSDLEAGIEKAMKVPTDDLLMLSILTENLLATRGSRGRSTLFDPLVAHVKRYLNEKGYGVTNQDVIDTLNGEMSVGVNAELVRLCEQKEAEIELLKGKLSSSELGHVSKDALIAKMDISLQEKDEVISKQRDIIYNSDEAIEWYKVKVDELSAKFLEQAKSSERAAQQIEMLVHAVERLSAKSQQQSGDFSMNPISKPIDIETSVSVSQANAALFNAYDSSGSGRFRIPMDTFEDTSTSNRPN